ncbi:MAG: hypothetical protein Q9216_005903 [Gyalolechia sp. 2 TL-2023]
MVMPKAFQPATDVEVGDTLEDLGVVEDDTSEVVAKDEVPPMDELEFIVDEDVEVGCSEVFADVEGVVADVEEAVVEEEEIVVDEEVILDVEVAEAVVIEDLEVVDELELVVDMLVVLKLLGFVVVVVAILLEEDKIDEVEVGVRDVVEDTEPSQGLALQSGVYNDES